jgi:aspartate/methionine/tyrosine aminotransferase
MAEALNDAPMSRYYEALRAFYAERRTFLVEALRTAGMSVVAPEGAYFVMADIRSWGFTDDVSFCRYLIAELGVAAIPPSAFYAEPASAPVMARFCFAKQLSTLQAAAERLQRREPKPGG